MISSLKDRNYKFLNFLTSCNTGEKVIVFLHGFMGSGEDWEESINRFSQHYYCIVPDLPGHGKTGIPGWMNDFSIENCADEIIRLLDRLEIERCFLTGYSMGGRLALYLVIHFSERFEKVALVSASPGLKTEDERNERIKRDSELADELEKGDLRAFMEKWFKQPLFENLSLRPGFNSLFERRMKNDPAGLAKSLREMSTGKQPSLWNDLSNISIPVLLLTGENDRKFVSIAEEMTKKCLTAKMKIVENCGHAVHFEKPESFIRELNRFFE